MKTRRKNAGFVVQFIATFLVMSLLLCFIRFPIVKGMSMEPTYHDGDVRVLFRTQDVDYGDVVLAWSYDLDEYVIKRVIGLGGDRIEIRPDHLYRNGVPLYETYVKDEDWITEEDLMDVELEDGEVFLMGDNRLNSKDSRAFGPFPRSSVFGVVLRMGG